MRGLWVVCAAACSAAWGAEVQDAPRSGLELYVTPPSERIPATGVPLRGGDEATLVAARGERESFFVVLRGAPAGAAVEAWATRLRGGTGVGAAPVVTVRRAAFVEHGGELWADALLPLSAPVRAPLREAENLALFVDVFVPRSASSGRYSGALTVAVGGQVAAAVPIRLEVLGVTLPRSASLPAALDYPEKEVGFGAPQGTEPARLADALGRGALAGRLSLLGLGGVPAYRLTPGEGRVEIDFAGYDAQLEPWMNGLEELDGAQASAVLVPAPAAASAVDRIKYTLAFRQHLKGRGWEKGAVELPVAAAPGALVPRQALAFGNWEECEKSSRPTWWLLPAERLALGADPAGVRAIGWLAYAAGAAGVRYADAFEGFRTASFQQTPSGSALFYPSLWLGPDAPLAIESVRLALLRDGLEDYELLKRAELRGAAARTWSARIAPSPDQCARAPERYAAAKRALAAASTAPSPVSSAR